MNITLLGYGKMGQLIEKLAKAQNINIASIVDPSHPEATHKKITPESLQSTDVCIDFTTPESVIDNIEKCAEMKVNMVIGTTGWYDRIKKAKNIVEQNGIGLIYASNFSIGVHIFMQIIKNAAQIINKYDEYDIFAHEWHHKWKKDSPSGTAITLGNILLKNIDRKNTLATDKLDRTPEPSELHFSSSRGGNVPGTHAIYFDSEADTIEIKHTARNRHGFALGAIKCAKWLEGKKGFFTIQDYLGQTVKRK